MWSRGFPQRAFFPCTNATWHRSVHWTRSVASFWVRLGAGLVREVQHEPAVVISQEPSHLFLGLVTWSGCDSCCFRTCGYNCTPPKWLPQILYLLPFNFKTSSGYCWHLLYMLPPGVTMDVNVIRIGRICSERSMRHWKKPGLQTSRMEV